MGTVDFHAIEARLARAASTVGKLAYHQLDVILLEDLDLRRSAHALGHFGQLTLEEETQEVGVLHRRGNSRCPQGQAVPGAVAGHQATVVQLRGDLGPVAMHGLGEPQQAGDHTVLGDPHLPALYASHRQGHPGGTGDDQASATAGLFFVVGNDAVAGAAVGLCEVCAHGRHHHAIFQLQLADAGG